MANDDEEKTPTPITVSDLPAVVQNPITESGSRNVAPNPNKPPILSPKRERLLDEADAKSAAGYDALDSAKAMIREMSQAVDDGKVSIELVVDDSVIRSLTPKDKI